MELIKTALTSVLSIIILFLLTKLIGNRQVSQMNMFDYINGITIGSIAAEMATSLERDFMKPLISMVVYAVAVLIISRVCEKSLKMRRLLNGKTELLFRDGAFYYDRMKKSKIDLSELLTEARVAGYFDMSELKAVFMEHNGRFSFQPKTGERPLTANDVGVQTSEGTILYNIIIDGEILEGNLLAAGFDREWLKNQLKLHMEEDTTDIVLATCDIIGNVRLYKKRRTEKDNDLFL